MIGVGALVAAGCGGDDDETPTAALSKQEFITQADAICTKRDQKLDRAGSEAFGKERPSKQEVEQDPSLLSQGQDPFGETSKLGKEFGFEECAS